MKCFFLDINYVILLVNIPILSKGHKVQFSVSESIVTLTHRVNPMTSHCQTNSYTNNDFSMNFCHT